MSKTRSSADAQGLALTSPTLTPPPSPDDELSLLRLLNVLLRRRWLVIFTAVLIVGVTVIPPLMRGGRSYAAVATFVPETERQASGLSGLAAQIGLDIAASGGAGSPQFYVDLLESPHLLRQVVDTRFEFDADTGRVSGNLVELLHIEPYPPAVRREVAVQRLGNAVETVVNARTGVVELRVSSEYPQLAAQIASRMLELLQEFNLATRQSRATAERKFLEARIREVRAEMLAAEGALQEFLQRNRDFRSSPELSFRQERLSREVGMRQALYSTLVQSYEQTRIEEVRDTPVITILSPPQPPVLPEPRRLISRAMLAGVVGVVVGVLLAFLVEFARAMRHNGGAEAREFSRLLGDIGRPWRVLRRRPPAA